MSERIGDWIQTYTGVQFFPLDPRPEDINIKDIAHALSMQCRFSGHTKDFYSVAEHSVRVAIQCSPENRLWGLLHDAPEAYLVDMPRPLKHGTEFGKLYREAEQKVMAAICKHFNLPEEEPAEVKLRDKQLLFTEQRDLMGRQAKPWKDPVEPLQYPIIPWDHALAEELFLHDFSYYESLDTQRICVLHLR